GSLTLSAGAHFNTASNFSNTGSLTLGAGSRLAVTGNFTQTAAGTLNVQIGGTPASGLFGVLAATGAAHLAGILGLTLVNGFVPANGNAFPILTFASSQGTFASIKRGSSGAEQSLSVTVAPTNVTVTSVAAAADLRVV